MAQQIYIIEDDVTLNRLIADQIRGFGYAVASATSWEEAELYLAKNTPDLIILDGSLPDASGYDLIETLATEYPVIMLTAFGSVPHAVKAMRQGASDYLLKPTSSEELSMVIERVFQTEKMHRDIRFCRRQLGQKGKNLLIGESPGLNEVRNLLDVVAPSNMTVLVHGESGVGKELIARELHFRSERSDKNFVALDCCTLQESLFETELFGHEKGAFTGADRRKEGLIDIAEGGTLFLDEIGEIGPAIQAKLLRVLETGQFRRVGSAKDLTADVRIVAATNRNLEEMAEQGEFRRDLFYRLNAFTITMPPLRERREDIPVLTRHFIDNHDFSRRIVKQLNSAALRQMKAYNWPGNVRELRNVVERAIILSRDRKEIRPGDLAFCRSGSDLQGCEVELGFEHEPSLEEIEEKYLAILLEKFSGHRGKIASTMGVSERSVYRMIQRYKLQG